MCKYSKYLEPWWTFSPLFIDGSLSNPVVVLSGFPNEEAETRSDSVMFGPMVWTLKICLECNTKATGYPICKPFLCPSDRHFCMAHSCSGAAYGLDSMVVRS